MNLTTLVKEVITLPPQFGITEEAEQTRNELILQSSQLQICTNPTEANSVGEAARDIRSFTKTVRDMGLALRRPLTAALTKIKAIEDDYCGPLEQEQARLERLTTDFVQAERRRVAEENRLRQLEIQRLENERLAAEQKAREEAERVARENREAEERARAAEAAITNKKQLEAAIKAEAARKEEAAKRQAEAAAKAEEARKASEAAQAAIRAPLPEAHKVGGMTTKRVMKWEVTDIHALYKARPELVKLEPKASAILSTCFPEYPVNGLKLWWEDSTSSRKW